MRRTKNRVRARLITAAIVVPLTIAGASGQALADEKAVTWKNAKTRLCLQVTRAAKVVTGDCSNRLWRDWIETPVGINYYLSPVEFPSQCLDSSDAGNVYLKTCHLGDYQKWEEVKTSTGWKLTNHQTGRVLDSNADGNVYTNPSYNNLYQRWE
ncbi:hypothetical protein [Streptomyces sp. NPDC008001]|uniref:RICIN domain-containing protein n=1 Tax=Streptomyces sp. NPDC008001 TaxID=3364804 RepID=UPI0036E5EA86